MSLRQPHEEAILSGEEIALVRQVLADCSQLLERAQRDAGPAVGALLAEATRAATAARRGPDGMIYHINLAIDYLDFAPAARRRP
jgi:hypothetical protein